MADGGSPDQALPSQSPQTEGTQGENPLVKAMKELSDRSRQAMHELVRESDKRGQERKAQFDTNIAGIEEQIKTGRKTPEQILKEARNDPQVERARAELSWIGAMTGKPTEGLDPELKEKIGALRQNAIARIMTDPQAYERDLQGIKSEFFRSRGIDLQNKPNAV